MNAHARVTWLTTGEPWVVEDELIKHGPRLPLNIRGSRDPYALKLKSLRAEAWADATDPRRFSAEAGDINVLGKSIRTVTTVEEKEY